MLYNVVANRHQPQRRSRNSSGAGGGVARVAGASFNLFENSFWVRQKSS